MHAKARRSGPGPASLAEYRRRRDFALTPEPSGSGRKPAKGFSFVVQKHAARRLHYDFRLELGGVLKSWAVPKGPSFDPADKRLAVQTEDHPVEYGGFEGVIPEGEYGGGTVLLWDRGTWTPIGDPHAGLRKGKLRFRLEGEKLHGGWTLVRIRGRDARDTGKNWLLIKDRDDDASTADVTTSRPESVASGRELEAIANERDRVWHSNRAASAQDPPTPSATGRSRATKTPVARRAPALASLPGARKAAMPAKIAPQLATLVRDPPEGDAWLHEIKYDGYRILCRLQRGRARLLSRNGNDWTDRFPTVAQAAVRLGAHDAIVDGEVAVLLPNGTTSFNALQNANGAAGTLVYFVFDLPYLDGVDLTAVRLEERKALLHELVIGSGAEPVWRYSDHVVGTGTQLFRHACRFALEGVVSKQRDAPYAPGRSRTWLKIKCVHEQEFVIGGFTEPEGRRAGIGALLIGVHEGDNGNLTYAGKVGTGFTELQARALRRRLDRLETTRSPFAQRPPQAARAHWVRPELVAEVEFTEWTPDGRLRHPSFQGLREDKPAGEIVRETAKRTKDVAVVRRLPAAAGQAEVAGVRLTHPDRVLYPKQNITKRALALYYEAIADHVLPHLTGRPTSLVRCPEGIGGECFYQKHVAGQVPSTLRRVRIQEKSKVGEYVVVDDLPSLIALVQIGVLEIHTWNSRADDVEHPDRLVFDLDPAEDVPWAAVVAAARLVRARLGDLGLESFLKTTGGKGLHLVVPLAIGPGWDACAEFARGVAVGLERETPEAFVATMSKARRTGKIFIDYLRNQRGSTSIAAFSTRARPGAPVSTPLAWDELGPDVRADHYNLENVPRRLASLRSDPWAGYSKLRQKLPAAKKR